MLNLTPKQVQEVMSKQQYFEEKVLDDYVLWSQGMTLESQFYIKWIPEL